MSSSHICCFLPRLALTSSPVTEFDSIRRRHAQHTDLMAGAAIVSCAIRKLLSLLLLVTVSFKAPTCTICDQPGCITLQSPGSPAQAWQVLPLVPPETEYWSPYSGLDALCGNPLVIDIEDLITRGLLDPSDRPAEA